MPLHFDGTTSVITCRCLDQHINDLVMSDHAEVASKDSNSLADEHTPHSPRQNTSKETHNYDIIAFEEGDQDNPYNWSNVSTQPEPILLSI